MNNALYQFVAYVLQTSKAHNVTIDGGDKYNIPPAEFTIDGSVIGSFLSGTGAGPSQNLTSYALPAISGADSFNDDNVTITDVFDLIVSNTREVTPTCKSPSFASVRFTDLL